MSTQKESSNNEHIHAVSPNVDNVKERLSHEIAVQVEILPLKAYIAKTYFDKGESILFIKTFQEMDEILGVIAEKHNELCRLIKAKQS